jgi:hypothetical protein
VAQSVHGADPVNDLYFPVTHAVQLKAGPDEPALQVHANEALHPASVQRSFSSSRYTFSCLWEG